MTAQVDALELSGVAEDTATSRWGPLFRRLKRGLSGGPGCFNVAGDGDVAELSGLSLPIHDGVVRASPGNGRVHVTLVLEGAPPSTARQLALVGATAAENPWQFADSIPLRPHSTGAWAVDLELEPGHHAVLYLSVGHDGHQEVEPTHRVFQVPAGEGISVQVRCLWRDPANTAVTVVAGGGCGSAPQLCAPTPPAAAVRGARLDSLLSVGTASQPSQSSSRSPSSFMSMLSAMSTSSVAASGAVDGSGAAGAQPMVISGERSASVSSPGASPGASPMSNMPAGCIIEPPLPLAMVAPAAVPPPVAPAPPAPAALPVAARVSPFLSASAVSAAAAVVGPGAAARAGGGTSSGDAVLAPPPGGALTSSSSDAAYSLSVLQPDVASAATARELQELQQRLSRVDTIPHAMNTMMRDQGSGSTSPNSEAGASGCLGAASITSATSSVSAAPSSSAGSMSAEVLPPGGLRLAAGACMIPHVAKAASGGEDAYFISRAGCGALGVSDGVSAWAEDGIDPGEYSRTLCAYCAEAWEEHVASSQQQQLQLPPPARPGPAAGSTMARSGAPGSFDPRSLVRHGQQHTLKPGSATLVVAALTPARRLAVANLGDGGIRVIRAGRILLVTEPQQHEFNLPYQLSHPSIFPDTDHADSADRYNLEVLPGDIIVAASDGLWDNMWDDEVLAVLTELGLGKGLNCSAGAGAAAAAPPVAPPHHRSKSTGSLSTGGSGGSSSGPRSGSRAGGAMQGRTGMPPPRIMTSEAAPGTAEALAERAAGLLARRAFRNAQDKDFKSPWAVAAGQHMSLFSRMFAKGGKMDDITVVVALVQ